MKAIFIISILILFSFQLKAQTNYDSLIVGSWKRIGYSSSTKKNVIFSTDEIGKTKSFFSNHILQEVNRNSLPYKSDSIFKYYIIFSLGFNSNAEWKIKNKTLYINNFYEGEIIKITKDTCLLYNSHEGGIYEKYLRVPSLKFYQEFEIDQLNQKEETFLKHKAWLKTQRISFSDTEYVEINKAKRISSIVYGKGIKYPNWFNKEEYDSVKLYYYRDGVLTKFEHQTLYEGTNICYTRHSFKDKSFWNATSDQNEYRNDREELLIGDKWLTVYEEKKSSNSDFSKPLIVYNTVKYYNEFGVISQSSIYKTINDTIYRAKRKNYTSFEVREKNKTLSDTIFEYATSSTGKRFHSMSYIKENFIYEKSKERYSTTSLKYTPDGDVELKIIFDRKGKVIQVVIYYKNGVKLQKPEIIRGDGKYTYCNPDGQLCCECEIKNGKIKNCHPIK
ncbi:MAG: hypothetical protein RJA07_879 [Bacteroidota bacterium]